MAEKLQSPKDSKASSLLIHHDHGQKFPSSSGMLAANSKTIVPTNSGSMLLDDDS